MEKRYTVIEPFAKHMPSFVSTTCFIALRQSEMVSHVLLHDLYKFFVSMFDGNEVLQDRDIRYFWNLITKTWIGVEEKVANNAGMTRYYTTS